jgi:hypothetical protein
MLELKPSIHIIALASFLFSYNSFAQDATRSVVDSSATETKPRKDLKENEGIVKFLVDVDNGYFEVLVNDTLWLRQWKDTLPEGFYEAKVWSPGYVTAPIEFTINRGETTEKFVNMVFTNDRQKFEKDYKSYRMKFHKNYTVPASISLAGSLFTGYTLIRAYDLRKKGDLEILKYQDTPIASEVTQIKLNVAEINRKYNLNRTLFYISSGMSAACWVATIYMYKQNNAEPTFNPSSPWKDKFSFHVTPFGCGMIVKI